MGEIFACQATTKRLCRLTPPAYFGRLYLLMSSFGVYGDSPPLALDFCRPCALSASAGADEGQARPFAGNAPPAAGSPVAHDLVLSQWHRPPVGGRRRRVPSRPVRSRRESRQAANAGCVGISQRKARQRRIDRLPARGKFFGSPDATRRRNSWPRPTKAPLKSFSDTRIACEAR